MNAITGVLYENMEEALNAGERSTDLVEITGTQEQVEKISAAVKVAREADLAQRRKEAGE